ncbi:MAG: MFS transporter [Deltaproteobacteria bacterium]|jgi:MFS family permease|nr:MFS transporter [Deltaproteobacteria bacterium]
MGDIPVKDIPVNAKEKVPGYAWVILGLIYFSSLAAPLNQFKVPPVMGLLMTSYQMTLAIAGTLMGIFALIGAILSLPSGFIMGRIGVKWAGLTALLFLMAGSALGAAAETTTVLMASRFLEGVGLCLMSIVAPTALATWFPPNKHGLALGIWGTWVPIGSIISFAVFPKIAAVKSWPGVAWSSFGYTAVFFVLFLILFRMPRKSPAEDTGVAGKPSFTLELVSMKGVLAKKDPWLLAFSFCGYMILTISLISFLPTFFQSARNLAPQEAANASQYYLIANTLGIFLGGVLADRFGSKRPIVLAYIIAGILMLFLFNSGSMLYVIMVAVALIGGLGVTPSFSAAPQLVSPADAGRAMAVLALGQNLGMAFGPPIFGKIAETSWTGAAYLTVPVLILAAFLASRCEMR